MLFLTIDSKIRFRLTPDIRQTEPQFVQAIRDDMLVDNPEYAEAVNYNRYAGNIPEHIVLWEYDALTGTLAVPRGYGKALAALLKSFRISWDAVDERVTLDRLEFGSKVVLRDYQVPAVEAAIKATGGVLQAPAGSGKTEVGLEIIARLQQPALWLTHTKDLANQAAERACKVLGLEWPEIGLIGDGVFRVGERLTIGIIQTLTRIPGDEMAELGRQFGTVVLDECHHGSAPTWISVMQQLPARYRFGVTATPERADGLEVITERVIGPTFYTVSRAAVSDRLMVPALQVINTGVESEAWKAHEERMKEYQKRVTEIRASHEERVTKLGAEYEERVETLMGDCRLLTPNRIIECERQAAELRAECQDRVVKLQKEAKKAEPKPPLMPFGAILDELLTNQERNQLIVETLLKECPGHYTLVLSKRVEHCLGLAHLLSKTALDRGITSRLRTITPRLRTSVVHGSLAKKVRENILELTRAGKVDVLFAVEIGKEGLDIPRLDRLFLVGGGRNEAETEQKVGRIQRIFPDKTPPVVFDFVDELIPPLRAQHWARRKVYRRLGMPSTGSGLKRRGQS